MNHLPLLALLMVLLASRCVAAAPADIDEPGAVVVRHLVERNFGAYPDPPWDVVCLRRHAAFRGEPEETFLRRFAGERPPVVAGARCVAADDDSRWVVEGTGRTGLEIRLRSAERGRDGGLRIEASASGGPIDFAIYQCTVVRNEEEAWQVEDCIATIMT